MFFRFKTKFKQKSIYKHIQRIDYKTSSKIKGNENSQKLTSGKNLLFKGAGKGRMKTKIPGENVSGNPRKSFLSSVLKVISTHKCPVEIGHVVGYCSHQATRAAT